MANLWQKVKKNFFKKSKEMGTNYFYFDLIIEIVVEVACYKKKLDKTLNTRYLIMGLPTAD